MTTIPARGLLFDCDGVLVDSLEAAAVAWDRWAAEHAPQFDFRRDVIHGRRAGDTVAELVAPEAVAAATLQLELMELDSVDDIREIPGAGALLRSLPKDSWAVVTSGARALALARLRAAGMPMPTALVTAEDVVNGKPDPEPYFAGAERVGVDPSDCVVFEDAPAGIRAAHAAGIGSIIGVGASALGDHGDGIRATVVVADLTAVSYVNGSLRIADSALLTA